MYLLSCNMLIEKQFENLRWPTCIDNCINFKSCNITLLQHNLFVQFFIDWINFLGLWHRAYEKEDFLAISLRPKVNKVFNKHINLNIVCLQSPTMYNKASKISILDLKKPSKANYSILLHNIDR